MSKTALELNPKQWQRYRPTKVRDTAAEQKSRDNRRIEQAWQVARQAAQRLREAFQAERVVLFGSLVHEEEFTPWSDIDLAAWGIPAERFYAAVAMVTGLSPDFKVDLIDFDTCRPALKTAIDRDGVDL